jgi:hypothetical protein
MNDNERPPSLEELRELVRRYHPPGVLDVDEGYAELPEVKARRAVQGAAPGGEEWSRLLKRIKAAWPDAKLLDHSTLHLDCGRQVRVMRDHSDPGHHLVAWVSLLAPVALIYESCHERGKKAVITPPAESRDKEGLDELARLIEATGVRVLPWDLAMEIVPDVAVGNLLPGNATLASCLFSSTLA